VLGADPAIAVSRADAAGKIIAAGKILADLNLNRSLGKWDEK
jgi:hypothetical protein